MSNKKSKTRRGNNEGSVFKRGDGKWVAIVNFGIDENGKRIRKAFYGNTRSEVIIKMTTNALKKLKGGHASIKNDNLHVLFHEWLMTFKRAMVCPRTFEKNLETARLHIYPEIGDLKLEDISSPTIQRIFNKKIMEGYALASVRKIKFLLNQFFDYAEESGFIESNPIKKTKLQSRERKTQTDEEYKAVPIEARQRFLTVIKHSAVLEPICMMQMFAGLRIGEVLALKWKDIDFENKLVNIDNAITITPKIDKKGNTITRDTVISDTKTSASMREVPMPMILVECLERWKKVRWIRQRKTGISFIAPTDLVFSSNDGTLRTYSGTRKMFDKLMEKYGMSEYKLHFHSLRHTYSSMLFEAGENPKVIQMLLGHKDVTTTIKTYNSVDRSYFKQATDKLDEKFQ